MSDALLITVAGVGAEVMRSQQPHLPLLPEEVGAEYARAFEAGATIGHVHGRKPDGTPTQDLETFRAYSEAIRSRCLTRRRCPGRTQRQRRYAFRSAIR